MLENEFRKMLMQKKEKERQLKIKEFKKIKDKKIKQKKIELKTKTKKIQKKVQKMNRQKINNSVNFFQKTISKNIEMEIEKTQKIKQKQKDTKIMENPLINEITINEYKALVDSYLKNYKDESLQIKKRIQNIHNKKIMTIQKNLKKIENIKENIEVVNKQIINKHADVYIKKFLNHEKNIEENKKNLKKKKKKINELKTTINKQHRKRLINMKHDQRDIIDKIKEESDEKFEKVKNKQKQNLAKIQKKISEKTEKWLTTLKNFENKQNQKKIKNQIYLEKYYKKNYKLDQIKKIEESINNNKAQVLSVFKNDSENLKEKLDLFFGNENERKFVIGQYLKEGCKSEKLRDVLKRMTDYEEGLREEERIREEEEKKKKNLENY